MLYAWVTEQGIIYALGELCLKVQGPFLFCSTELSMKFQLLIKGKMMKNKDFSCFKTLIFCIYPTIKVKVPANIGILTFISRIR